MYNVYRIDPHNWQNIPVLEQYVNDLSDKPYCSYIKNHCHIRSKSQAIGHVYIQPNSPVRVTYIVLDIDHPNGIHTAMYDSGLPPPHLIIQNPVNSHVHLVYRLTNPVYMWGKAKAKHIRYLARVEHGMVRKLGADAGYGGNLMKNPLSDTWTTYTTPAPIEGYTLKYLAQFVNLDFLPADEEASNDAGYGRNCSLFDLTRTHGYHERGSSYSALVTLLTPIAEQYNNRFDVPLFHNEVMQVVRSIARYCVRTDFVASDKAFSETQSKRSKRRWGDSTEHKKLAQIWADEGVNLGVIAERLEINRKTLTRWGIQKKIK